LRLDFDFSPVTTASALRAMFEKLPDGKPLSLYVSGETSLAGAGIIAAQFPHAAGIAGIDPLTAVALSGEIPADREQLFADAVDSAHYLLKNCPNFLPLSASDQAWHLGGGSAREELGFTLSAAVAYWRALSGSGLSLEAGASAIGFFLTAT